MTWHCEPTCFSVVWWLLVLVFGGLLIVLTTGAMTLAVLSGRLLWLLRKERETPSLLSPAYGVTRSQRNSLNGNVNSRTSEGST